jgi:hypothetical protein
MSEPSPSTDYESGAPAIRPDMNPMSELPTMISLRDITNSIEVIQAKELDDGHVLETIGSIPFESLKASLIQWALLGYPNAHVVHSIVITPPSVCSDGVERTLGDYISFCSGKSIYDHVAILQSRMTDITVSFVNFGSSIGIVVSKSS